MNVENRHIMMQQDENDGNARVCHLSSSYSVPVALLGSFYSNPSYNLARSVLTIVLSWIRKLRKFILVVSASGAKDKPF